MLKNLPGKIFHTGVYVVKKFKFSVMQYSKLDKNADISKITIVIPNYFRAKCSLYNHFLTLFEG